MTASLNRELQASVDGPAATAEATRAVACARQEIATLSSLPAMDARLLKIVGEPDTDTQYEQLSVLLHADPALAARVLKVANSAFYGASRAIESIARALEILGTAAVTGIAMAASLDGTVSRLGTTHMGYFAQLHRHSLVTAIAAQHLARRRPMETWAPETAFVLGLLHDLGWLVQLQLKSDSQVRTIGAPTALDALVQPPPQDAGHAVLGAALFAHWGLPMQFAHTVLNHHMPVQDDSTPGHRLLTIADQCAHLLPDRLPEGEMPVASDLLLDEFQLTETSLPEFASQMVDEALLISALVRN